MYGRAAELDFEAAGRGGRASQRNHPGIEKGESLLQVFTAACDDV